jgi:hypothetical protein
MIGICNNLPLSYDKNLSESEIEFQLGHIYSVVHKLLKYFFEEKNTIQSQLEVIEKVLCFLESFIHFNKTISQITKNNTTLIKIFSDTSKINEFISLFRLFELSLHNLLYDQRGKPTTCS